ncbi:CD164 sialomucin-like 2 protein [Hypomesus transpacificus]|uniref:CD164 sialomucin-like 2 protein n=1 Tax=Hypomesus transpacificus TaxID=137520 RepID=UPI001F072CEB|nr:CD164 sialomucin-like 2 protein [Hypomesus transpacificus]
MQGFGLKTLGPILLLLAMVTTCHSQSSDCSQAESCDLCVGDSTLNLTGCVWRNCDSDNDTGCVSDDVDFSNCNVTNDAAMCTVVENAAEGKDDSGSDDQSPAGSEFSQAKFDMSSFVGGIILVLCLQAGGFFAMRFLKSKDNSTYDPIEQPQP